MLRTLTVWKNHVLTLYSVIQIWHVIIHRRQKCNQTLGYNILPR